MRRNLKNKHKSFILQFCYLKCKRTFLSVEEKEGSGIILMSYLSLNVVLMVNYMEIHVDKKINN